MYIEALLNMPDLALCRDSVYYNQYIPRLINFGFCVLGAATRFDL